jgi:diguanylate cyclase (GGDEF)-like protein/PAS domain S-box-containing protein
MRKFFALPWLRSTAIPLVRPAFQTIMMLEFLSLVIEPPESGLPYAGRDNRLLIALSLALAMFVSFAALLVSRHMVATNSHRRTWLLAGCLCLGMGIYTLPCAGSCDYGLTVVSTVPAALARWIEFRLLAAVMGLTVDGMHYTAVAMIIGTIVATYIGKYKLFAGKRWYRPAGLLIGAWILIAAAGVAYFQHRLADDIVAREALLAQQQANDIGAHIESSLQQFKGIPRLLVQQEPTRRAMRSFGPDAVASPLAQAERRRRWSGDPRLARLSGSLATAAAAIKADAIVVVNAAGDCVAASNGGQADSFVGVNYADRDHFLQARAGAPGQQYAVGRVSKVAGLFFAYPLIENGRFLGAVIAKRNLSALAARIRTGGVFLSDANGVIVFSADQRFTFRTLPGAAIDALPAARRVLLYQRSSFAPLSITPWDGHGAGLVRLELDATPVLLATRLLAGEAINVHLPRPQAELVRLRRQGRWLFALIAAGGATLIVAACAVVVNLGETRRVESELRIAATAFETQEGMVITDAARVVLRTNRAYSDMTGFAPRDVLGRALVLADPAHHDAAFLAALWQVVAMVGSWQGEIRSRRKDGQSCAAMLVITAVRNAGGEVTHYVCALADITARKRSETEMRNLALHDFLTGLPNRRYLMERLQQALAVSVRSGLRGAMLFIDLDNFKDLNDTLGHNMGDLLLQQVAARVKESVRENDTVARLGSDEFVVIVEGLDLDRAGAAGYALMVGQKIQEQLRRPYTLGAHQYTGTASIGVTLFRGQAVNVESLLKQTDLAMHQSKSAGRDTLHFFAPAMQALASARASLDSDLRQALLHRQFQLHYQPQVDAGARLVGAEALLRWHHPQRGMVGPADFIGAAEESGLILALGDWVLTSACAQLAAWDGHASTRALRLSVNVSPRQFRQPDFVARVLSVLGASGADPRKLKLELTESVLLDDVAQTIARMETLKTHGVGISLDDFGTGYSSLAYLKRLPLCELKIDRSFVRDIPDDAALIKTILTLAHNMGIDAVAEGVETAAQRDYLAALGCQAFQGFLFGHPMPPDEFGLFAGLNLPAVLNVT